MRAVFSKGFSFEILPLFFCLWCWYSNKNGLQLWPAVNAGVCLLFCVLWSYYSGCEKISKWRWKHPLTSNAACIRMFLVYYFSCIHFVYKKTTRTLFSLYFSAHCVRWQRARMQYVRISIVSWPRYHDTCRVVRSLVRTQCAQVQH